MHLRCSGIFKGDVEPAAGSHGTELSYKVEKGAFTGEISSKTAVVSGSFLVINGKYTFAINLLLSVLVKEF